MFLIILLLYDFCVDDFSRVKISQVDLKDDDTDYINATLIDVSYNIFKCTATINKIISPVFSGHYVLRSPFENPQMRNSCASDLSS